MTQLAMQLSRTSTVQVSTFYVLFAYGLCAIALVLALRNAGVGRRGVLDYLVLFTWFVAVSGFGFWVVQVIRLPPDSVSYWRWANMLAEHDFSAAARGEVLKHGVPNLGLNAFVLLEAGLVYVLPGRYELLQIFNIMLATFAIFFACQTARMLFGARVAQTTLLLFMTYFALYWSGLQNLREAIVLFFIGAWLWMFLRWRAERRMASLIAALASAVMVIVFRVENFVILAAFVALYALATARSALQLLPRLAVVVAGAALAVRAAFAITGGDPLRAINFARRLRMEGGNYLELPDLTSYTDIIWQAPINLSFFLVPVKPWQLDVGAKFIVDYVSSLSAFVLLSFGIVGAVAALRRHPERKLLAVFLLAFLAMAAVYSVPEVSSGSAARHSLFWYYFLMMFSAVGVNRVRAGLAHLAAAYRRAGPGRLAHPGRAAVP